MTQVTVMTIDEIIEAFDLLDDWEERYRYVIELGKSLPGLRADQRNETNRVKGCASNVWLVTHVGGDPSNPILTYEGESDAHIVKGLVAVTLAFYSGKHARDIIREDAFELFRKLGFEQHLTPQRSNGVRSMIDRIRRDAGTALAGAQVTQKA
jgi:cysteine desulfuration protein SufE